MQQDIHFNQLQNAVDATFQHPFQSTSQTLWMLRCNIRLKQLRRRSGLRCNITSFARNSKTLRMLHSNINFNQLPRRSGCYVVTSFSINFPDALDATLQHNILFKKLQDALHATFQHKFQATSWTLWMLRCNIHFNQLRRRSGCYVVTSILSKFEDALDATFQHPFQSTSQTLWMLLCNIDFKQLQDVVDATL